MQELALQLRKRRIIATSVIILVSFLSLIVSNYFDVEPINYFDGKYNTQLLYFLIIYKLIELPILYYILFHRHLLNVIKNINVDESFPKIKKHTMLLFFLIPQGNIVFGIISYKIGGDVLYFQIFTFIALIALFLTKPNKFLQYNK